MNLKATYLDGNAIIYNEKGEMLFKSACADAREAQVRCLSNPDTRKALLEKLNVISVKIKWVDEIDGIVFDSSASNVEDLPAPKNAKKVKRAAPLPPVPPPSAAIRASRWNETMNYFKSLDSVNIKKAIKELRVIVQEKTRID